MTPKVLFIGSIGAVAETSEVQRIAYNQALKENNVNWEWSKSTYKKLLKSNGGIDRLETLSAATNQNLPKETITNIHSRKTELAAQYIVLKKTAPRAGLQDLIEAAKKDGCKVAWVTTTGAENTNAILNATEGVLTKNHFDYIFHRHEADNGKPAPDIYHKALSHFNSNASECIAIEDSKNSMLSAKSAGIFTVVTPGAYHNTENLEIADLTLESLAETNWESLKSDFVNAHLNVSNLLKKSNI